MIKKSSAQKSSPPKGQKGVNKKAYKPAAKGDALFTRWKSDYFKMVLDKIIEGKKVTSDMPQFETKNDLRNVNLRKLEITGVSFKGSLMHNMSGYSVQLNACDLSDCYIKKGDFAEAKMIHTRFESAKLSNCSFTKAIVSDTSFKNAIVENCDFTETTLTNINVENTILDNSNFSNLQAPESILFIGTPKSTKNIQIDETTFSSLQESAFKTAIIEARITASQTRAE